MSQLFAFNHSEEMQTIEVQGHYDNEQQVWVGNDIAMANDAAPDGLTVRDPTGTITFPFIPDADITFDWV